MSMRSQVYEWANLAPVGVSSALRRSTADVPKALTAGREYDLFIGGTGNNITKPAETTATQFIVIEDIACSPHLGGAIQIRINTTDYFQNPDVTDQAGIPGLASPYPRGAPSSVNLASATPLNSDQLLKSFDLYPDVYVLPGQTFQILYTAETATGVGVAATSTEVVAAFVKYTLYDGPDALIANKLLELGVTINPNNVDWYKRSLIEQQQRSASMAAAAAMANGGQA
ncbi:MAG: hypothetical protein CMA72_08400 [Euryarchaeota archaeon]|jgi:hypothetical protein|nr:hypothetical protein [Euryarchaeota archaeon]